MSRGSARASTPPERVVLATNRRARHDYLIHETVEAGLVLVGSEVKSLRERTPALRDGHARIRDGEMWLHGVHIAPLPQASYQNHDPTRIRKCLMKRREIRKLTHKLEAKGMTLVALSLYFLGSRVKVELGLGKGRAKGDRRHREREKHDRRQIDRHR